MLFGNFKVPKPYNEPVCNYAPESQETKSLLNKCRELLEQKPIDIPVIIAGKEYKTETTMECRSPHNHSHLLGTIYTAGEKEVKMAIDTALEARKKWANTPFFYRVSVFLRAAELITSKYRDLMNASTMLGQSKTCYQAEIEAACELADFLRFNALYAEQIYNGQPNSTKNIWNWVEYRPLEGFVFAITPFNFTAIACNLCAVPALMGNVVVWKPSPKSMFSSFYLMKILEEAGLPPGVINMVPGGGEVADVAMQSPDLAGIHFTGSTQVFRGIWKKMGDNIASYKSYPRLVGETGGKDFMVVHESANADQVATAIIRGAFEYQGQKCSAASRAYISDGVWPQIRAKLEEQVPKIKVGDVTDFSNFLGAVIDKGAYDKIVKYIEDAKKSEESEVIAGGTYDDSKGYFIHPTVILTKNPQYKTMVEEIFGPVITIYVYPKEEYTKTLELCDGSSSYGLTGGIFAGDTYAVEEAYNKLRNSSGNFYINDKVTGAVVDQQPFGGSRASGTNDKAGSYINLLRWVSTRSIKQCFVPPENYEYPFMQ